MRLLSALLFLLPSLCFADPDLLHFEGVYSIKMKYVTDETHLTKKEIRTLEAALPDRMIIMLTQTGAHLALSQAESGTLMYDLPNVIIGMDHTTKKMTVMGAADFPTVRQIEIQIDPETGAFTGVFASGREAGFFEVHGKPIHRTADVIPVENIAHDFNMEGLYKETKRATELTYWLEVRAMFLGASSLSLKGVTDQGRAIMQTDFGSSFYFQDTGLLIGYTPMMMLLSPVRKLTVAAIAGGDGKQLLKVQSLSTTGKVLVFTFEKVAPIRAPDQWSDSFFDNMVKGQMAEVREWIKKEVEKGGIAPYTQAIQSDKLVNVLKDSFTFENGYTSIYVAIRKNFYPRAQFKDFLTGHVNLMRDKFVPLGLKGFLVRASEDYIIAVLKWESKEAEDAAMKAVGQDLATSGNRAMRPVLLEPY
jgi:hypothetical protein